MRFDEPQRKTLVKSLAMPQLDYCRLVHGGSILSSKQNANTVQRALNEAMRTMSGFKMYQRTPTDTLQNITGVASAAARVRKFLCGVGFHAVNAVNGSRYEFLGLRVARNSRLTVERTRLASTRRSPGIAVATAWNGLSVGLRSMPNFFRLMDKL